MLRQGGFAAAIGTQNRDKCTFLDLKVQVLKYGDAGRVIHARIAIRQMFNRNCNTHAVSSHQGVQRPVEPQGSMMPVDFTGRPNSPTWVCPPCFSPNTTSAA